jgi:dCMP deaminase
MLLLLGEELIAMGEYLHKEIRALDPVTACRAIGSFGYPFTTAVADTETLSWLTELGNVEVVMPDEDVSQLIADRFFASAPGVTVTFDQVFLRWDRKNTLREAEVATDRIVSASGFLQMLTDRAYQEAAKASNWWRQVGAIIFRGEEILLVGSNRHVPSPHTPYIEGDPRNAFKRGLHINLSTDHHAEARLVCEAARRGIQLEGASLFVTTFPCPLCAKDVAAVGIRECYFVEGYAVLDGERSLRSAGIAIIRVDVKTPHS